MPARRPNRDKRKALSLFAGAGGMDLGVDSAGFKTLLSVERDVHASASLCANAGGKIVWQTDVRALDPLRTTQLLRLGPGDLDLLYGAPPSRLWHDTRGHANTLVAPIFEMVRFAEALRPTCVLIEQRPSALASWVSRQRRVVGELHRRFEVLGYDLHVDLLDAGAEGLSQVRIRAALVAVPAGCAFELALSGASGTRSVAHAWQDLPAPTRKGTEATFSNHLDVTPPRARERIQYVPEGAWLSKVKNAPVDVMGKLTAKDTTKFRRLAFNNPSPTLFAGEIFFHPIEDRYITPREAARLQGFPDSHVFHGPIGRRTSARASIDQHRQIAESTPPPFAKALALKLAGLMGD